MSDHRCAVQRNDLGAAVGIVIGQEAATGAKAVAGEGNVDVDLEDLDFEDIAGFGFGDSDGAGKDMTSGTFVLDLAINVGVIGRNIGGRDALLHQSLGGTAGGEGLNADRVARVDGEHGFGRG